MPFSKKNIYGLLPDEELMKLVCKQNNHALEELYKRYNNKLQFFFFRMLNKDKEKAKDCMHDLFLKIIEKGKKFDTTRKFSTWIYSLAWNMFKNELRKDNIANKYTEQIIPEDISISENCRIDVLDHSLYKKHLDIALESLDESRRVAFILRYQEELSIKEISEIMQCPEGTVKSRIFYAIDSLSKILKPVKQNINYDLTEK